MTPFKTTMTGPKRCKETFDGRHLYEIFGPSVLGRLFLCALCGAKVVQVWDEDDEVSAAAKKRGQKCPA